MFEYETNPFHWVNRLGFLVRKQLGTKFQNGGHRVSPEEWAILLVLWNKGPQTPSDLAERTIKDRTTVTRLIDAMVRKGLVNRSEDPNDRRRSLVEVSDLGRDMQGDLEAIAQAFTVHSLEGVSKQDLETTTRTLRTITQTILRSEQRERD